MGNNIFYKRQLPSIKTGMKNITGKFKDVGKYVDQPAEKRLFVNTMQKHIKQGVLTKKGVREGLYELRKHGKGQLDHREVEGIGKAFFGSGRKYQGPESSPNESKGNTIHEDRKELKINAEDRKELKMNAEIEKKLETKENISNRNQLDETSANPNLNQQVYGRNNPTSGSEKKAYTRFF